MTEAPNALKILIRSLDDLCICGTGQAQLAGSFQVRSTSRPVPAADEIQLEVIRLTGLFHFLRRTPSDSREARFLPAWKKREAPTDKPAQAGLGQGTATNGLSTKEAARPRHGHPEDELPLEMQTLGRFQGDGLSYCREEEK